MNDPQLAAFAKERRSEFPIFAQHPKWSYLDSAATAQKPQQLIDFLSQFWAQQNAPLHRGVYRLSSELTQNYESVRQKVATFLGAASEDEIVFCRGCTEAINLVAHSFVAPRLERGDNIVITSLEHHANFVPWQQLCQRLGAELRLVPLQLREIEGAHSSHLECHLDISAFEQMLDERTRFVALNHVSNALGLINPVQEFAGLAKQRGIPVLLDGAQAVMHGSVDVAEIGCDFYAFSGHKLYGPDGVGVLYGKSEHLAVMSPYQTGGDMIEFVSAEQTSFLPPPQRFEAGTMPVSAILGLGAAIDYFQSLAPELRRRHEQELLQEATEALRNAPSLQKVRIIGDAEDLSQKIGVISFVMDGVHPHDVGSILDSHNVAVRAGHHCAQPLMATLGLAATTRISLGLYNDATDIQRLCAGLEKVIGIMT